MKLKIVNSKKLKGYVSTKLTFSKKETAEKYVDSLNQRFLFKKAQMLEYPLSKRKENLIKLSNSKRHLLTKEKNKFLLWEEY